MHESKHWDWDPTNLQTIIDTCGMNKRQICQATHITPKGLNTYLTKVTSPSIQQLLCLADFFAVPLDYICSRCTKEECDAIEESFADNFRLLRKRDYESMRFNRKEPVKLPKYCDDIYPYNLLDDIFQEEFDHIVTEDEMDGLNSALATLNEREQDLLYLKYQESKSLREIGAIYNKTQSWAQQIIARAVRKLRHPSRSRTILYGENGSKRLKALNEKEAELKARELNLELLISELEELNIHEAEITETRKKRLEPGYDDPRPSPYKHGGYYYSQAFEDLDLSVRSFNCLVRTGCDTVTKIIDAIREGTIIKIVNLGQKSVIEIIEKLKEKTGMSWDDIIGETDVTEEQLINAIKFKHLQKRKEN